MAPAPAGMSRWAAASLVLLLSAATAARASDGANETDSYSYGAHAPRELQAGTLSLGPLYAFKIRVTSSNYPTACPGATFIRFPPNFGSVEASVLGTGANPALSTANAFALVDSHGNDNGACGCLAQDPARQLRNAIWLIGEGEMCQTKKERKIGSQGPALCNVLWIWI